MTDAQASPIVPLDLDVTEAAHMVAALAADPLLRAEARGALSVWARLLGFDDPAEALALAEDVAASSRPVTAHVPPL